MAPALLFLLLAWRGAKAASRPRLASALAPGPRRTTPARPRSLGGVFRAARARARRRAQGAAHTGIFELENPLAPLPPLPRAAERLRPVLPRCSGRMAFCRCGSRRTSRPGRSGPLGPRTRCSGRRPRCSRGARRRGARAACATARSGGARLSLPVRRRPADLEPALSDRDDLRRAARLPAFGRLLPDRRGVDRRRRAGASRRSRPRSPRACSPRSPSPSAARTVVRNPVWQSDEALFTNMVRVSPESAKAHYDFAYMSAEDGAVRAGALEHYVRATEIYPGYWDAWAGRGRMERELGDPSAAEKSYPRRSGSTRRTRAGTSASAWRAKRRETRRARSRPTATGCGTIRRRCRSPTASRCSSRRRAGPRRSSPGAGRSRSSPGRSRRSEACKRSGSSEARAPLSWHPLGPGGKLGRTLLRRRLSRPGRASRRRAGRPLGHAGCRRW